MNPLVNAGILEVFHYTPLHYLPFIARASALKSKPRLAVEGFAEGHFRSMSRHHDVSRGFGDYLHLTTHPFPPILAAKLAGGFPHVRLAIPTSLLESQEYDLCRFNVAMTRKLRRRGKPGFPESSTNGRYYGAMEIPIAREAADKTALLSHHAARGDMVEILIRDHFTLSPSIRVETFSRADYQLALRVVTQIRRTWQVRFDEPTSAYPRSAQYASAVLAFAETALNRPDWRGDGLEFDRVTAG